LYWQTGLTDRYHLHMAEITGRHHTKRANFHILVMRAQKITFRHKNDSWEKVLNTFNCHNEIPFYTRYSS
jgi:hypothetical protein